MKKTFFYGYVIIMACLILQIVMFAPRASFGVFIKPLTTDFEWSRALVAGAFSVSSLVQGLFSILMGGLNDRLGPRVVLTICGVLVGVGLMCVSLVNAPWQLYLFYVLLVGPGMGGLYSPQMSTVARWFVKRRNIMTGLLMAGGGVGGFIGPPLITWLVYTRSWRDAFLFIGSGVFVLVILASQFLRRDPSKMGQVPYGEGSVTSQKTAAGGVSITLKQSFRTRWFWMLAFTIFGFGFCFSTVLVHIVPLAIDRGIPATTAAIILSVMNIAMTLGSITVGLIGDRFGSHRAFITCICLLSAIVFFLLPGTSAWMLGVFAAVMAFGGGGIAVLESTLVADIFGLKSHGAILGCIVFSFTLGGAAGPFIAGSAFDATGSYQMVFLICIALVVAAIIIAVPLTRRKKAIAVT